METHCRNRTRCASPALALVLTFSLSSLASAQIADSGRSFNADALNNRKDADLFQSKASDLLIATHDASGSAGFALPLEIKLVRMRNVYIEAIKLLGLPRDVTISDSNNTFSSSSDNNDVDVSAWDLSKIQITQNHGRESSFSLAVAAIWTPENGGHFDVTSSRLNVNFIPDSLDGDRAASAEPGSSGRRAAQILETAPPPQAIATVARLDAPISEVFVPEAVPVAPRESTVAINSPALLAVTDRTPEAKAASLPRPVVPARPSAEIDRLVERAKGLIRLGDISGARLLLERAQAHNAPNATFLLAQTWDPAMLRAWKVRGLRADLDLARSLYAKAASEDQTDERQLAATGR